MATIEDCKRLVDADARLRSLRENSKWWCNRREELRKELQTAHQMTKTMEAEITSQLLLVESLKEKVGVE